MQIRKDYILDRWVYYSPSRANRQNQFKSGISEIKGESKKNSREICYFCPGNEHLTPPEIGRISKVGKSNSWKLRWFPNKFPAVDLNGNPKIDYSREFFVCSDSYGSHEVIAETDSHAQQLWDFKQSHIAELLGVYKNRILELSKNPNSKYILVFKNHGAGAGTSLRHSHTQVVSLNNIPKSIRNEIEAGKKYKECPYCSIIRLESKGPRKCFQNKHFIAIAPYASRFNYEIWIFPRKHMASITELNVKETSNLAEILLRALKRLKKLNVSYNYYLHNSPGNSSPDNHNLHFHVEICPRDGKWGGFEFGSGHVINSILPEHAARFYAKSKT